MMQLPMVTFVKICGHRCFSNTFKVILKNYEKSKKVIGLQADHNKLIFYQLNISPIPVNQNNIHKPDYSKSIQIPLLTRKSRLLIICFAHKI